jgi:hypothetical protein
VDPDGLDVYQPLAGVTGQHAAIGVDADPWHPGKRIIDVYDFNPPPGADISRYLRPGKEGEYPGIVEPPTRLDLKALPPDNWVPNSHRRANWGGLAIVRIPLSVEATLNVTRYLKGHQSKRNKDGSWAPSTFGGFNAARRNCSDFVKQGLRQGGLKPDMRPTTPDDLYLWATEELRHKEIIKPWPAPFSGLLRGLTRPSK